MGLFPAGKERAGRDRHGKVDRFLEHPRVVITHNDGDPQVYISSADWMTRNIDHRIEVAVPVRDPRLKQRIIDITNIHFTDTVKARFTPFFFDLRCTSRRGRSPTRRARAARLCRNWVSGRHYG